VKNEEYGASLKGSRAGELCECGHLLAEHAESGWGPYTVCVEKLDTFPEGGWAGVCPCVRDSARSL
jgi:hypothetical protein